MKLGLGSAQFGLDYGIHATRFSTEDITPTLALARQSNIDLIDTAPAYGSAEELLGKSGIADFKIITKLPSLYAYQSQDMTAVMENLLLSSLNKLKQDHIYGLLLHKPKEILEHYGLAIVKGLEHLKLKGLVKKVGISIYEPDEIEKIEPYFNFDILQSPFNLFDQRLLTSGWLEKLNKRGVEIHVRSIFLQGLLLSKNENRPAYFNKWSDHFDKFHAWLSQHHLTAMQAALRFSLDQSMINQVIVGIDNYSHLRDIVAIANQTLTMPETTHLQIEDVSLINPTNWSM